MAHHESAGGFNQANGIVPWIKTMQDATKGRIKITEYPGQTLAKTQDALPATISGVCDMAWFSTGTFQGVFPLSEVLNLPLLPLPSTEAGSAVSWQLYQKFPEIQKEFSKVKILTTFILGPYYLGTTAKKQVKVPDDLKGLKIRTIGGPPTQSAEALGAVPVAIGIGETYLALQKGTVDGMGGFWSGIQGYRFYEVLKYLSYVPLYANVQVIAMNLDKWNSLPKDIQDQLMSVNGLSAAKFLGKTFGASSDSYCKDLVIKQGGNLIEYSPTNQEIDKWTQIGGQPLWNKWITDMKAKNLPGQAVLDETVKLFKEYR